MVLLAFSTVDVRDGLLASTDEAELVRVPVVEHREEEFELEMGDKSHEVSVASPELNVWVRARSLDVVVGCAGASVALDRLVGSHGGVCSVSDVAYAIVGNLSRVNVDVVKNSELVGDWDSLVGLLKYGEDVGTVLAPILGSVLGGFRKVKSVNCLVEALASLEQRQIVAAARSRKGRGCPGENHALIDAGNDVVNVSLTEYNIWVSQLLRYMF
ncbi:hypothetical protein V6N11_017486 [Hibiscus sabdariffa]|uniref:Uncharacterized protein n=1 Tax=Hibiscus sabdariffa TaxID=183260 RepID=A0ABR2TYP1_9ROSI